MGDDRQLSAWILIAGSVAVGWWYWRLPQADKLARLGRGGSAIAPAGGFGLVPAHGPIPTGPLDGLPGGGPPTPDQIGGPR